MSINALTSGSSTAINYTSRLSGTSAGSSAQQAGRRQPPDEGGGLLGAIADALKSIGVDGESASATSAASTDTTASTESDNTDTTAALGSFLENLMAALHAQGGESGAARYGEPPEGGPGKLSSDLQSLISALGDGAAPGGSATSAADGTGTDSSVAALQGAFANLLTSLGGDAGDANAKLSSFLETLSSRLPSAGSAGNLIDTTA